MQFREEFKKASKLLESGAIHKASQLLGKGQRKYPQDTYGKFLSGTLEYKKRNFSRAIELLSEVVDSEPDYVDGYVNLGSSLWETGRCDEASRCYQKALELHPDNYTALNNLGSMLKQQKRYPQAQRTLEKAISLRPTCWLAKFNLGSVMQDQKKYCEAEKLYRSALQDDPNSNVYVSLLGVLRYTNADEAFSLAKEIAERKQSGYELMTAFPLLVESCDWALAERIQSEVIRIALTEAYPVNILQGLLMSLNKVQGITAELQYKLHCLWGARVSRYIASLPARDESSQLCRPMRVAYLSADFRDHSVAYFTRDLLTHHDESRFEIFCYSTNTKSDAITGQFRSACQHFYEVHTLTERELADKIRADDIDVLIDLGGHTSDSGLSVFCYRPAPVQITYLGYPNTTGLESVDYRISAKSAESVNGTRYCEELLYLPDSFLCFGKFTDCSMAEHTPARENGFITFGCFNNVNKLTRETMSLWSRVLLGTENSRLLIRSLNCTREPIRSNLLAAFMECGVAPERIELSGGCLSKLDHLESYNRVDISLDTLPYNGTTTTCETLWMGVPLVTIRGQVHASRVSAAILSSINMNEMIAGDEESFLTLIAALADDLDRLDHLREIIPSRIRGSALCQPKSFTVHFEKLLEQAWEQKIGTLPWERREQISSASDVACSSLTITIKGDIRVVVPNDIEKLTPYVLLEQEDWFEQELDFIRTFLKTEMSVLDIGANYGIYSLVAASKVGEKGSVLSVEPCSGTVAYLRESVRENGLDNVIIVEAAISDHGDTAFLELNENSEMNSVISGNEAGNGNRQAVQLISVDSIASQYDLLEVDFVKIDAEGFEARVIDGGVDLFSQGSPLVMFEVKHGSEFNLDLVDKFATLGYQSYRLVPGLNLLVPFDCKDDIDPALLNLFCCKPERAEQLALDGLLVEKEIDPVTLAAPNPGIWVDYLVRYPFATRCLAGWQEYMAGNASNIHWQAHQQALDFYAQAQQQELPVATRYASLVCSYRLLYKLVGSSGSNANLQTFVRVAVELGCGAAAREALGYLLQHAQDIVSMETPEPFLPASSAYEWMDPGEQAGTWMLASVFEQFEKIRAHSSYFASAATSELAEANLEMLRSLGYQTPEMERRRQLISMCKNRTIVPVPSELLSQESDFNLNYWFWNQS